MQEESRENIMWEVEWEEEGREGRESVRVWRQ